MTELERFRAYLDTTTEAKARFDAIIEEGSYEIVDQIAALARACGFSIGEDDLEKWIAQAATEALRTPDGAAEWDWEPGPTLLALKPASITSGKGNSLGGLAAWLGRWLRKPKT